MQHACSQSRNEAIRRCKLETSQKRHYCLQSFMDIYNTNLKYCYNSTNGIGKNRKSERKVQGIG